MNDNLPISRLVLNLRLHVATLCLREKEVLQESLD